MLILDEIQTGLGRTGRAARRTALTAIEADVTLLGKGVCPAAFYPVVGPCSPTTRCSAP